MPADREYQCLGQWEEDGHLFTYAKRRDVDNNSHECFVGSVDDKGQLFLIEAGVDCKRGLRVTEYGMKLRKKGKRASAITLIDS